MNGNRSFIRLLLLGCACVLTIANTSAQQYKTARTNGRVFYEGGGEMHTIQVVSRQELGGVDTAFTFYTVVDTGQNLPPNCDLIPDATGWLGQRMVVQDSLINLFFNAQGDTIRFRPGAALGNVYPIYHFPNGDYIEATNNGLQFDVFIDSFSRFKTIQLQARNSSGQAISHPMNGKTMEFSERFGLKKGFNLWHFPNDTTTYRLIGHELARLGQRPLNVFAVFDIRPGFEFHFIERIDGQAYAWEKHFVQEAFDVGAGDTFVLTYERWRKELVFDGQGTVIDSTFDNDTLTEQIAYAAYSFLNGSHRQVFEYATDTFGYAIHRLIDSLGPRFRKDIQRPYALAGGGICLEPLADSVMVEHYGDGLGQTALHVLSGNGKLWQRDMVYYQVGIEQWGNSIAFPPLGVQHLSASAIEVYPNPVSDQLMIKGLTVSAEAVLVDLQGRKVLQQGYNPGQTLQLGHLPAGLYVMQLRTANKLYVVKILKQ